MDEENSLDDSSTLFDSVLSGFTDEQWEEYNKQKNALEEGYVITYDSDVEDSRASSPCNFDDEVVTNIEVVQDEKMDVGDTSSEDDGELNTTTDSTSITFESNAAVKYVNGDITFLELADIMENSKQKSLKRTVDGELKDDVGEADVDGEEVKKHKTRKPRRRMYQLPKELEGLMGMANLSFAKGNSEKALDLCMELIRQAPMAQQPYQTLGMIYEEMGDMKQSLKCSLLAAYLDPTDTDEWIRLAGISMEQSQIQQAIKCYNFAIRNEPQNINFLWERCNLYELLGDRKNALTGYEQILQALNRPEDADKCVEISREVAKVHHENEDLLNAIKVLENAFIKFPVLITSEDVNFLLELQITKKCYKAALKNFVRHCAVSMYIGEEAIISQEDIDNLSDEKIKAIERCTVPDVLPIDLQMKLLRCLIHLEALKAIKELLNLLMEENVEEMGDLYLDVAEAFMDIQEFSSALPLLNSLVNSQKYNLAAVWLKYGDCLNSLSRGKEASGVYETVLKMAPSNQEARISLSKILIENGKKLEAVKTLKQEYEDGKEDAIMDLHILIERCNHLYDLEEYESFIKASRIAMYSHTYPLELQEEFLYVLNNQSYKRRYEVLRDLPSVVNRPKPAFHKYSISINVMWDIFQKLCHKLFELKRYQELERVCLEGMVSNLWRKDKSLSQTVEFYALLACYFNNNHNFSYVFIKDTIMKTFHSNRTQLWNLFCLHITLSQQIRYNRFCLRLFIKNHDNVALGLFNGHCAMNSGSYKHALGLYVSLLKKRLDDPFLLFFTGITYAHMACQKFATKRFLLIAQAIAFLHKYVELRNENQEALYNMGRTFHQLGIKDAAVIYYKKALEAPPVIPDAEDTEVLDLKHEISYNLGLLYQSCGSHELASTYFRTYNVV